jgi:hypothetical protein
LPIRQCSALGAHLESPLHLVESGRRCAVRMQRSETGAKSIAPTEAGQLGG